MRPPPSARQRSSSPRRDTMVSDDVAAGRTGHGPSPWCSSRPRPGGPAPPRHRARAPAGPPVTPATSTASMCWWAAVRQVRERACACPARRQVGPHGLVGQDGRRARGDVVDVERVDERAGGGPGSSQVDHAGHLVGDHRGRARRAWPRAGAARSPRSAARRRRPGPGGRGR